MYHYKTNKWDILPLNAGPRDLLPDREGAALQTKNWAGTARGGKQVQPTLQTKTNKVTTHDDRISPGISRLRGVILYELQATLAAYAR